MKKIFSFDVFDTCLTRRVGVPSTLFYEVAQNTYNRLNIYADKTMLEDFVAARIKAEQCARYASDLEDITLDKIWETLNRMMGFDPKASLYQCELEAEEKTLVPIERTRRLIQQYRSEGHRIIFISDMYLPSEFIKSQLEKHRFAEAEDTVYVSGDIGKMKISGNLFRHVLDKEGINCSMINHFGDNLHSDHVVPGGLEIKSEHFTESRLTETEKNLLQEGLDYVKTSRVVGAMKSFRMNPGIHEENITELCSQFIAPFIMGFVVWVLQRAYEQGVKRLYFLSRDCELVCKVAQQLSPHFENIDCRYLYVSRQALYLPSAQEISSQGMPWMQREFEKPILKNLLAKLELNYNEYENEFKPLVQNDGELYVIKDDRDWAMFWNILNQNPIKQQVHQLINVRQESAKNYFESIGAFDNPSLAIVDFGWLLSCQKSMQDMFLKWGYDTKLKGYYLGLKRQRQTRYESGFAESLFYENHHDIPLGTKNDFVFQSILLLEHIVGCADHPSVHHYTTENMISKPSFSKHMDQSTLNFSRKLHSAVLDFVALSPQLVEEFKNNEFCRITLSTLNHLFFKNPSPKAAQCLKGLSIALDQNGLDACPIVKQLTEREFLSHSFPERYPIDTIGGKRSFSWWEGSLAVTPIEIKNKFIKKARNIHYKNRITKKLAVRTRIRKLFGIRKNKL